jgi:hypothetical protein
VMHVIQVLISFIGIVGLGVSGGVLVFLMGLLVKRILRKKPEVTIEFPQLARIDLVPMLCRHCGHPLQDKQLVVYFTKNTETGWRSTPSHAHCAVMIKYSSGVIRSIHGKEQDANWDGTLKESLPPGTLLLSPEEWDKWSAAFEKPKGSVQ